MSVYQLLKRHWKSNRALLVIFTVCQICAVFAFCFIFLLADTVNAYYSQGAMLSFVPDARTDSAELSAASEAFFDAHGEVEQLSLLTHTEGREVSVRLRWRSVNLRFLQSGFFFDAAAPSGMPRCIVPELARKEDGSAYSVGDVITLLGVDHTVCAVTAQTIWSVESVSLAHVAKTERVELLLSPTLTHSEVRRCAKALQEVFPTAEVSITYDDIGIFEALGFERTMLLLLVPLIANVNFFALFLYILKEDRALFRTLRLFGCSYRRALCMTVGEILMLCAAALVLGLLLFQTVVARLLAFFNPLFVSQLSWLAVGAVFAIYLLGAALVLCPLVRRQLRNHVFVIQRGREKHEAFCFAYVNGA